MRLGCGRAWPEAPQHFRPASAAMCKRDYTGAPEASSACEQLRRRFGYGGLLHAADALELAARLQTQP